MMRRYTWLLILAMLSGACYRYVPTNLESANESRPLRLQARGELIFFGETSWGSKLSLRCPSKEVIGKVERIARDTVYFSGIISRTRAGGAPARCIDLWSGAVVVDTSTTAVHTRRMAVVRTAAASTLGGLAFLLLLFVSGDSGDWMMGSTVQASPQASSVRSAPWR